MPPASFSPDGLVERHRSDDYVPDPSFLCMARIVGAAGSAEGVHIAPRYGGDVFIYADESGNSGRKIFDTQPIYRQGAILAVEDIQPALESVILPFLAAEHLDRIHAHQLPEERVAFLGTEILDALNNTCPWTFHITEIEKSYVATTKFVDTVFDSGENLAVPWLWYNFEMFRHTLCCLIDKILTPRNKERFWESYLADDMAGIQASIRNAKTYLDRLTLDRRLRQVVVEAFLFVLSIRSSSRYWLQRGVAHIKDIPRI